MAIITTLAFLSLVSALENPKNNFPNLIGGSGNLRTFSALANEKTTFGVSLLGNFFAKDPFISDSTGSQIKNSRNQFHVNGNYTFDLGVPIEVFAGFTFTYNDNSDSQSARTMTTFFENFDLGVRYGTNIGGSVLHLGGYGFARALSGTRTFRNHSGGTSVKAGPWVTGSLGLAQTLDFSAKNKSFPLRQNFNVGYRGPNGTLNSVADEFNRFALDTYKYHALVAALSLEVVLNKFTPFVEYSLEQALNSGSDNVSTRDNRHKATAGVKITPMNSFAILAAADFGIFGPKSGIDSGIPRNPPYDIFVGLHFQTLGSKLFATVGSARGIITDAESGRALSGVKVSVGGSAATPVMTAESGLYDFPRLKNGNYQVTAEKDGYEMVTRSFSVRDGGDTLLDLSLAKAGPKKGNLSISVFDQATQEPIKRAVVGISGTLTNFSADDSGRILANEIEEGPHQIHAEAPGYVANNIDVVVKPRETISQVILLDKAPPEVGICAGFVKNAEGTPLTAVFTTEDGKIQPFGTDPVTGAFTQSLSPGHHTFKVQAENYLPKTIDCDVKAGDSSSVDVLLEKPKQATVVDDKIVLPDAIYFEFNKDVIKKESYPILDQVLKILLEKESYKVLRVEGHTDSVGADAYNQGLSERRARAVRRYLIKKGVAALKVEPFGFGEAKPVSTNLTPEGRGENRRVEFNLVR